MKANSCVNDFLPLEAEIVSRTQESRTIFTLHLRFTDKVCQDEYFFHPGQFNMLYLYGVGEVAISIVSDPNEKNTFSHTIRAIGRVTRALQQLQPGDRIGVRGPFGRGWPLIDAKGKDVVIITGGLGCAPTVSVINYILARRSEYGALTILQGVKHSDDFIFRKQYAVWAAAPNTSVHIAADVVGPKWSFGVGYVTDMINTLHFQPDNTMVMMCGPEMMMHVAIDALVKQHIPEENLYLSMERNMECGLGQCGHCQYGGLFICKDGPIFSYPEIKALFYEPGF